MKKAQPQITEQHLNLQHPQNGSVRLKDQGPRKLRDQLLSNIQQKQKKQLKMTEQHLNPPKRLEYPLQKLIKELPLMMKLRHQDWIYKLRQRHLQVRWLQPRRLHLHRQHLQIHVLRILVFRMSTQIASHWVTHTSASARQDTLGIQTIRVHVSWFIVCSFYLTAKKVFVNKQRGDRRL